MFRRGADTYVMSDRAVDRVLDDPANPICQISELIHNFGEVPSVLDIGAGSGLLAMSIKRRSPNAQIDGIESCSTAADIASQHYRNFYRGRAQDFLDEIAKNAYDFVILADVIEHMEDPLDFLQSLHERVDPSCKIVLSTPNVAFGAVRIALMNGDFRYVDSGLLERTHLRFFTRETLVELVRSSGFHCDRIYFLARHILRTEIEIAASPRNLAHLFWVRRDPLAHVYQFLVVLGRKSTEAPNFEAIRIGKRYPVLRDFLWEMWRGIRRRARPIQRFFASHSRSGRTTPGNPPT